MKKYSVIGIIIVILVIVGGWQYLNQSSVPEIFLGPTDWGTYENTINKYTISVPQNWQIDDTNGVYRGIPGEVAFFPPQESTVAYRSGIYITITDDQVAKLNFSLNTQEQYQDWIASAISTNTNQRQYKIGGTSVAGIPAIQYVTRALPGDPTEAFYYVTTWFRHNKQNYNIQFVNPEQDELKTYDKILSTFKFIQ